MSMKTTLLKAAAFCCLVLLVPARHSWAWWGKVVELADGDSGVARKGWGRTEFRLYGIDAPEFKQPFGRRAKSFVSRMMLWKDMEFKTMERDRYGREVGLAYVDGRCVNEELIKAGLAWVYRAYCREDFCVHWLELQRKAKNRGKGLWKQSRPLPPWQFREMKRSSKPSPVRCVKTGGP